MGLDTKCRIHENEYPDFFIQNIFLGAFVRAFFFFMIFKKYGRKRKRN